MRWPLSLLFRGDRDAPSPGAHGGAPGEPGAPGAPGEPGTDPGLASGGGESVRPAAWPSLAPIQRTVGEAPLTAPTVAFGRDLAGLRRPDPILRPLGHDVAADGPAGLVSGIATPLVAASGPAGAAAESAEHVAARVLPPHRGVQRRARSSSSVELPARPGDGGDAVAPPAPGPEAGSVGLVTPSPRVLPVVAPSAVGSALAATRVAPATAPDPARVLAPAASRVTPLGPVTPADPMAASGSGGPVQWSAPASAPPAATPPSEAPGQVSGADPVSGSSRAESEAAPPSGHHSLGASRRLGLGAPLAGRPSVQRIAAGSDLPLVRTGRAPVPAAVAPAPASPVRRAAAAAATLPVLRVAADAGRPAASDEPGHDGSGRQASGVGPATGVRPAPPLDARPHVDNDAGLAPRATPDPRRPSIGDAQRRVVSHPADGADVEAGSDPVGPGVGAPAELAVPAGTPSPVTAGAGARSSAAPVAAPVAAPAAARSTIQPAPNQQLAPTSTASAARAAPLVVARSLRGSDPLRSGAAPAGVPGRAMARVGGGPAGSDHVATAAPAAHGAPGWPGAGGHGSGMPVARAVSLPGLPVHGGAAIEKPVSVSRLADTGDFPPPPPGAISWSATSGFAASERSGAEAHAVQRAVAIDEMTTGVAAVPAAGGAAGAAAGDPGSAGTEGAGQDYEEMADRVYDRIRSRFATELLLDRERMGLLIDG